MVYNLTEIGTNTTGLLGFTQSVNTVLLDGYLGVLILLGVSTILFLSYMFRTGDVQKALGASSFIAFGLSILLGALGLLPNLAMLITLVISAATLALTFKN